MPCGVVPRHPRNEASDILLPMHDRRHNLNIQRRRLKIAFYLCYHCIWCTELSVLQFPEYSSPVWSRRWAAWRRPPAESGNIVSSSWSWLWWYVTCSAGSRMASWHCWLRSERRVWWQPRLASCPRSWPRPAPSSTPSSTCSWTSRWGRGSVIDLHF